MELTNEILNLVLSILVSIPVLMGAWHQYKQGKYIEAIHVLQKSIGEGGEVEDVVNRISNIKNKVIEKELPRSGAKIIE